MSSPESAADAGWLRPPRYDASAESLTDHARAIGEMMAGRARLWLGPFDPPPHLPPGYEDTALVVPTSGSTGTAKAVALTRGALLASQDATAALFAADGTAAASAGHGFWLPLLPPTHIAGVQVIARAHRTAQVLGRSAPALPDPLPDLRGHFDSAVFVALAEPALAQAEAAGLPALTSLVPTQLTRIVTGAGGADARARSLLKRFAAVLVGGAASSREVLARAQAARIPVRTTYGSSETAGGCVYDGRPLEGVQLELRPVQAAGASTQSPAEGRLLISSPALASGYLSGHGGPLTDSFEDHAGRRRFVTSDLASIEDGVLRVIGRADDVIVTGGRKVLPQDVEHAIDRSLMLRGMVRDAVVVGVADAEWGRRIEALVTLAPGIEPQEATALVRSALRTSDVPAHAIPKRVHAVTELPLLGAGKIDRPAAGRIAAELSAGPADGDVPS